MSNFNICLIINIRNGEKYLSECLKSLCEQSFKNFKIYIFDNLSKDNSYEIIDSFKKEYSDIIEYFKFSNYLPINQGRNYALNYLKNKKLNFTHFSFCDCDDIWEKNWLLEVSKYLDHHSIIYTDGYELIHKEIRPLEVNHLLPRYSLFSSRVYLQGTVVPFSYVTEEKYFDEKVMYYIDVDKWNEFFEARIPFIHVKKKLFFYRIHDTSLSSSGFKRLMKDRWILTKKYKKSKLLYFSKFIFYSIKHYFSIMRNYLLEF